MSKKVVVIGGGLGGLSGSLYLAAAGHEVHLYEKNDTLGGKVNQFIQNGFTFDTGPSLLTMPFVIDDLFESCGYDTTDFLQLQAIDTLCRYFWDDGTMLDARTTIHDMQNEIKSLSTSDADRYEDFFNYSKRLYDLTKDVFLYSPIHELKKILNLKNLPLLFHLRHLDAFRTVHQAVSHFFTDPRIVQLFDRYCTYNGSDPYKAPATLNIIPYVEYGLGGFYIKGGMYNLIKAMEKCAEKSGVIIHKNANVNKIYTNNEQVEGIAIGGDFVKADAVLCNNDVVSTFQLLIDGYEKYTEKLETLEPSLSGLVFLWGIKGEHKELEHHNIFFSKNYRQEFNHLFDDLNAPDDPTVYVAVTSKKDPSHALNGYENWFVLVNMPYLNGQDWPFVVDHTREKIFNKLMKKNIDIRNKIELENVFTPQYFSEKYASNRGSIYGISSNNRNMAFKRPPNRSKRIKGLYFAGASTHPGGGVPLTILSGKIAAELILENTNK